MVVPALIYLAITAGTEAEGGWGIPTATDIAIALGVLGLLGARVAPSLKLFLLALAIVDDIGAILVIAIVYSDGLDLDALLISLVLFGVIVGCRAGGVRYMSLYVVLGAATWIALHEAGVTRDTCGRGVWAPRADPSDPSARVRRRRCAHRHLDPGDGTRDGDARARVGLGRRVAGAVAPPVDELRHRPPVRACERRDTTRRQGDRRCVRVARHLRRAGRPRRRQARRDLALLVARGPHRSRRPPRGHELVADHRRRRARRHRLHGCHLRGRARVRRSDAPGRVQDRDPRRVGRRRHGGRAAR